MSTGYNQSVTGCRSQRRQCSCYSMKSRVNSMILILKLNLTSLRNINIILIKSGLRWAPHTFLCICFLMKSNSNWGLDHAIYISFHWVTTTCLRWEPQPVTLWLYPVIRGCLYGLCPKATGALSVLKKMSFPDRTLLWLCASHAIAWSPLLRQSFWTSSINMSSHGLDNQTFYG